MARRDVLYIPRPNDRSRAMNNRKLLNIGIAGSVIAALCCFTPVLVVLLGVVGLSAFTGTLDLILLPALALFPSITVYALWKRTRT